MCIAIFKPEDHELSAQTLDSCWENNPDGAGFMFSENNSLVVIKGLMTKEEFLAAYEPHAKKRVVLHFRVATHGSKNADNTHPFVVNKSLAFVHNGVIQMGIGKDGEFSDTYMFNEQILKGLPKGFLNYDGLNELIQSFIKPSKVIFMDSTGAVTIFNSDLGKYVDGIWYSNESYKDTFTRKRATQSSYTGFSGNSVYQRDKDRFTNTSYKGSEEENDLVFDEPCEICSKPLYFLNEQKLGICAACARDLECPSCKKPLMITDLANGWCVFCRGALLLDELLEEVTGDVQGERFQLTDERYVKSLDDESKRLADLTRASLGFPTQRLLEAPKSTLDVVRVDIQSKRDEESRLRERVSQFISDKNKPKGLRRGDLVKLIGSGNGDAIWKVAEFVSTKSGPQIVVENMTDGKLLVVHEYEVYDSKLKDTYFDESSTSEDNNTSSTIIPT